jgi:uncharacterized protein (TIGR02271 family)
MSRGASVSTSEKKEPVSNVIPVIREELKVEVKTVDTGKGVRVTKTVSEDEKVVDQPLTQERLIVERVPVGRLLKGPQVPGTRYEGDTLVVPVLEEVLVVEKKVRLKEEVRITRSRQAVRDPQSFKLKTEEVSVERFDETAGGSSHGERSDSGI